jgi:hypothetical protein
MSQPNSGPIETKKTDYEKFPLQNYTTKNEPDGP